MDDKQIRDALNELKELKSERETIHMDLHHLKDLTGIGVHNHDEYVKKVEVAEKKWETAKADFLELLRYTQDINGAGERLKLAYLHFKEKKDKLDEYDKHRAWCDSQLSDIAGKMMLAEKRLISAIVGEEINV